MYYWRKLTDEQRKEVLEYRRIQRYPKHSPPHFDSGVSCRYLLSAACYEHTKIIGVSIERMSEAEQQILEICSSLSTAIFAWCFLPDHYHVLLITDRMADLRKKIGLFNGRSSFEWNREDKTRGRKVWHNCFERKMRSQKHFYATLNYVLHNPVHHGYVEKWEEWPWSNASEYLESIGHDEAVERWRKYPVLDYGKGWDD